MKRCPYCAEDIQDAAIKCRYCGSMLNQGMLATEWYRSRNDRMLAGVCAGLGKHFGVSVTALRLALVILTIFVGWGIIVYAVLWVVMPLEEDPQLPQQTPINVTPPPNPDPPERKPRPNTTHTP